MKPRIRCYTLWDTWWYQFPDGVICRMDQECTKWIRSWNDLYTQERVPFLFF